MIRLQDRLKDWFLNGYPFILPGLLTVIIITGLSISGAFEQLEFDAFDWLMRHRSAEVFNRQITLVTIDDRDIQGLGTWPVPLADIANAIEILQGAEPRVIGMSVLLNLQNANQAERQTTLNKYSNIVGAEIALNEDDALNVPSAWGLPASRVGFIDPVIDKDGSVRRKILVGRNKLGELKYAFALQLARYYLAEDNIFLNSVKSLEQPIRIGNTEIARVQPTVGFYRQINHLEALRYHQILINFSADASPFATISLSDLLSQTFDADLVRDHIVIFGMAVHNLNRTFPVTSLSNQAVHLKSPHSGYSSLFELEIEAYATEHLLQSVLAGRPSITILPAHLSVLWIFLWGLRGIVLSVNLKPLSKNAITIALISLAIPFVSAKALLIGWWLPTSATLMSFVVASSITALLNQHLRNLLDQRRSTIKQTFESIHNGPLQTLALISRQIQSQATSFEMIVSQLEVLNKELRNLYEQMEDQYLSFQNRLFLHDSLTLNLSEPLSELLFQVFEHTLSRPFPGFRSLRASMIPDFSILDACQLRLADKRALCLFLEETLCNVGKYGLDATYIKVICQQTQEEYSIEVINNHNGRELVDISDSGYGTYQATLLAKHLKGSFQRFFGPSNTLHCQLKWPKKQAFGAKIANLVVVNR